ncbi:C69 family dipeptidase [Acidipropionibacterium virtanenii]|uniref:Dipeptidase n=1 Tax=Acidipropionibacterium virtanenii TaxID=2057246 RepID=A0A344UXY7_9ACTN|nr:C69 family dipeptidase [Acidipropionibacterium virtanenii]AXE40135.1 Dipeptidase [Acidipropionibacterium virtanenii]
MGCTTILVGKRASYDGSPLVARNEDSANGEWNPKKIIVVPPADQPRSYISVIGHLTIELPQDPMRYTAAPNAIPDEGIWGAAGINAANVAMSATETLTTNERVLGADPFVEYRPAHGREGAADYVPEKIGGIGEEDMLTIVLPYIHTAREGVLRLGELLEEYGTYEMNGIAFSDADEIWWLETVGGHHWIARRVPDDQYVTMPNQLGIDSFDLDDAMGEGREHLASPDLAEFIHENHLDLSLPDPDNPQETFNPREAFGSHSDSDHVYNTPRAWNMQRVLNPHAEDWDGPSPEHTRASDDLPWGRVPERRLTIEDVKYVLSLHYQGTVYDPYSSIGTEEQRHLLRPIGINRHSQLSILQVRPYKPESSRAIQWVAFASNPFNTLVPMFTNVERTPEYLANTTERVTTDSLYWASRIIAALTDAHFNDIIPEIERYQEKTLAAGHTLVKQTDARLAQAAMEAFPEDDAVRRQLADANDDIAEFLRAETDGLLGRVLEAASNLMTNRFSRSDF